MPTQRALIFVNGTLPNLEKVRTIIHPDDVIIAANGGTRHAHALEVLPDVIMGDFDSLSPELRQWAKEGGVQFDPYPRDKDETDLELALAYALEQGYCPILILAAIGGRLDQTLGNLLLVAAPHLAGLEIRLVDGVEEAWFMRDNCTVHGEPGDLVSLLPWGGDVHGVCTSGLRWPLQEETLYPHRTRGISNQLLGTTASISLRSGLLLVIHRRRSE